MIFEREIKIRFQHCDPAGIVFYPRYFEMLNQMVEDWFSEALHMSFQSMHLEQGVGVPTVHIEADFVRASRIGDVVTFGLRLTRLGSKSFDIGFVGKQGGEERLRAKATLACVTLGDQLRGAEIPPAMRAAMLPYLVEA